jgi:hypothetical protein
MSPSVLAATSRRAVLPFGIVGRDIESSALDAGLLCGIRDMPESAADLAGTPSRSPLTTGYDPPA